MLIQSAVICEICGKVTAVDYFRSAGGGLAYISDLWSLSRIITKGHF
jgi:hypothetical protein